MKGVIKGKPGRFYIYLGLTGKGKKGVFFFFQIVDTEDNYKILHDIEFKIKDIDDQIGIMKGLDEKLHGFAFDERFVLVGDPERDTEKRKYDPIWENGRRRNADGSIDTACLRVGKPIFMFLVSYFPVDHEWLDKEEKREYEVVVPHDLYLSKNDGTFATRADDSDPLRNHFQIKRKKKTVEADDDLSF